MSTPTGSSIDAHQRGFDFADHGGSELLGALWDFVPSALALSDPAGTVLRANRAYYDLYGFSEEEIVGRDFAVIFPEEARQAAHDLYRDIFDGPGTPQGVETTIRRKDGEERRVEARVQFLHGSNGIRVAMLNLIRDITDQARAEGLARAAESARESLTVMEHREAAASGRERELLLATVSHNLLNPLSAIKGEAQLLAQRVKRGSNIPAEDLATIAQSVDRMADQMTNQIRELQDFAQLEAGQDLRLDLESIDLAALTKDVLDAYRPALPQEIAFVAHEKITGLWDRNRLRQSLANLMVNASKYSEGASVIEVRVWREPGSAGDQAIVEIEDHGIGIAPEAVDRIFEPFFRAPEVQERVHGTGLGLASTKRYIELHGGAISVESQHGRGSIFRVRLPITAS